MPVRVSKDLTDYRVKNAKPAVKQYEIFDRSVGGFALRVAPSGSRSYVISYRCKGKKRRMTLGNAAVTSLADAREAAMKAKSLAKSGIDPLEERRQSENEHRVTQEQDALNGEHTFTAVSDLYIQRYARGNNKIPNKKTWAEDERILRKYVVPRWGMRQISDIGRSDVVSLLDFVEDNSGLYQANRVLAVIRKLFNWSLVERALIEVTPIVPGMARKGEKRRQRVLNDDEIRSVWRAMDQMAYPFGHLFQLLLATGQRRGEVEHIKWSQLNVDDTLWTIPSSDTKADRGDHLVPLNSVALKVLENIYRIDGSDLLFPTSSSATRPVSGISKAKARCDALTGSDEFAKDNLISVTDWRLHDLRRTAGTIMEDELAVAPHIIGAILNHDPNSYKGVTAIYTVGRLVDDRRRAMDAWGKKLESLINPDAGGNVLPMKKMGQ